MPLILPKDRFAANGGYKISTYKFGAGERTNLITSPNDLTTTWSNNGAPTLANNQAGAPNGTATCSHFTRTVTAASYCSFYASVSAISQPFGFAAFLKQGAVGNYGAMRLQGSYPNRIDVIFNLSNGTIYSSTASGGGFSSVSSIIPVGNGWYRCYIASPTSDAVNNITALVSFNSNGAQLDGTDSASNSDGYVWGARMA